MRAVVAAGLILFLCIGGMTSGVKASDVYTPPTSDTFGSQGKVPSKLIWHYILEKKTATEIEPASSVVVWFDSNGKLETVAVHGAADIEANVSRAGPKCS